MALPKCLVAGVRQKLLLKNVLRDGVDRFLVWAAAPPGTRSMTTWEEAKERYLTMPIEQKRKEYKCGDSFTKLSDIPTWSRQMGSKEGVPAVSDKVKSLLSGMHFECDPELNNKVSLWKGSVTELEIDVVVNAANSSLMGGGGVDGAVHSAAGSFLREENRTFHGCDVGDVRISGAYKLPCKYLIHTVGPQTENTDKLQSCYAKSLSLAHKNNLRSVAFPCIATGVYGFPNDKAAKTALWTVRKFLETKQDQMDRIIFCVFLPVDEKVYQEMMQIFFPLR